MATSPPVDPSRSRRASGFGVRTGRTSGNPTFHAGLDFRGSCGDPIFAAEDGVVEYVGQDAGSDRRIGGYGNVIAIRHPSGQRTVYAHLSRVLTAVGARVEAGKLIGRIGNTTNGKFPGMGCHLHFEVRQPGRGEAAPFPGPYRAYNIDPEPWLNVRGVRIAHNGQLSLDASAGGVAPRVPSGFAGLGDSSLDLNAEGLPAEPLRDPWTFEPLSPVFVAGAVGAGAAVFAIGVLVFRR
jgi:hypothetical protein